MDVQAIAGGPAQTLGARADLEAVERVWFALLKAGVKVPTPYDVELRHLHEAQRRGVDVRALL